MFECFFGRNYSDSPKYIYEYLAKNYPDEYQFVWVVAKQHQDPVQGKDREAFFPALLLLHGESRIFCIQCTPAKLVY